MSLTQYLESQKDQDMIRLLNFTKTQGRRDGVFVSSVMNERKGIYSSGRGNINGKPFNEG